METTRLLAAIALGIGLGIGIDAPRTAVADDGVDHAMDVQRRPNQWNMGDALRVPTLTGFDPGDPRVGVTLLVAYAPTPMLIVDRVVQDLESRPFDIVELIVATAGTVAATWGFVDSFDHPLDAGLAIESLATAHALSWNLQLLTGAATRLLVGDLADHITQLEPSFLPFTVDGGGGVVAQWQN